MDRRDFVKSAAVVGGSAVLLGPNALAQSTGTYRVRLDVPKQELWGLGFEIQSDSILSGNGGLPGYNGVPNSTVSVPHDLIASERTRFATEMIGRGHGFRYMRLAGGLYMRGLRNNNKNLDERWAGQYAELASLISTSGLEGVNFEYWSPPPYWKSTNNYINGSLKQFDATFLGEFATAVSADIQRLKNNGIPVVQFGLQNEALLNMGLAYSHCTYTPESYATAYNIVAAKIRADHPTVKLHANSWDGQSVAAMRNNLDLNLVDHWTWHRLNGSDFDSTYMINNSAFLKANAGGKPVYSNEFEYLDLIVSEWRLVNTAQNIMNWFTFVDSPTWYWLHALKPTYNEEAAGFALGYWRPDDDNDFSKFPNIQKGRFDYELRNWRGIVGFLEWMPWNSRRYQVDEPTIRQENRILAFRQGGSTGKLVIVVTNRGTANFTFNLDAGMAASFRGYRYSLSQWQQNLGVMQGPAFSTTMPPKSIEFWVQQ